MYLVLLILGVVLALAGAGTVAYGIPINGFDLGNTLIIAGTTALTGGLILVGLSQIVKQLRRIAERFGATSDIAMPRIEDLSEPAPHSHSEPKPQPAAPPPAAAPAARIPFPPKPAPRPRAPAPAAPEPRLETAPPIAAVEEEAERRPPPPFVRVTPERIEPEREEIPEEAPLPPAERRFAEPRVTAAREEREQKDTLSEDLLATAFSRLDVALRETSTAVEPPRPSEGFKSRWPAAEPRRAVEEADPPPSEDVRAPEPDEPPEEEPEEREEREQVVEEPYAVSILKSGVIDGMAYTLYSDGSIEAEMQQGTMRFASITELRAYLEKSSS